MKIKGFSHFLPCEILIGSFYGVRPTNKSPTNSREHMVKTEIKGFSHFYWNPDMKCRKKYKNRSSVISNFVLVSCDYRGHIDYIFYGTYRLEEDNMMHSSGIPPFYEGTEVKSWVPWNVMRKIRPMSCKY